MADDDFFSAMAKEGVTPLASEKRVALSRKRDPDQELMATLRAHATSFEAKDEDPLSGIPETLLRPMSELSFVRPGVQQGVYKRLRLGKYPLEARLDLHRLTIDQARVALMRFIRDCMDNELRTVLITHGKGEGRERPALLKSCVNHWMPQIPEILAFHTAQKQHGSYGATYVMLKKSEEAKQRNRQAFKT